VENYLTLKFEFEKRNTSGIAMLSFKALLAFCASECNTKARCKLGAEP